MSKKNSLKKIAVAFCLLLSVNFVLAQAQNPLWNLQPNYGGPTWPLPGTNSLPTATTSTYGYTGDITTQNFPNPNIVDWLSAGPSNMYGSNNPAFFVNGSMIYNRNGYLIDELYLAPSGTGYYYDATGYTEICVVPRPGSCSQYYVFTSGFNDTTNQHVGWTTSSGYRPYYALIDVAANGGAYMPTSEYGKNITPGLGSGSTVLDLINSTHTLDSIKVHNTKHPTDPIGLPMYIGDVIYAATKQRSDGSRLLFMSNNDFLIVYKITSTGVYYLSCNSLKLLTNSGGANIEFGQSSNGNLTEMEIYTDSVNGICKLAMGGYASASGGVPDGVLLASFSLSTGVFIANTAGIIYLTPTGGKAAPAPGIEFSPNGNYVYFTNRNSTIYSTVSAVTYSTLAQYSISGSSTDFQYSQIEAGTDGSLYLIKRINDNSGTLYKIQSPNTPSSASVTSVASLTNYAMIVNTNVGDGTADTLKTFSLPDQIDDEVYGSQFDLGHASACCLLYEPYDKVSYYAGTPITSWTTTATTQTWSPNTSTVTNNPLALNGNTTATVTIGEELRIPAGYSVTINNMVIEFSPQARLIIEDGKSGANGGYLTLNNCTLKVDNRCGYNDMWPGVQIWGSPSNISSNQYHGYMYMYQSQIQDAYNAVVLGYNSNWASAITPDPGAPYIPVGLYSLGTGWFTGGGGIIQTAYSTFLNNANDIYAYPYSATGGTSRAFLVTDFLNNAALLASGISTPLTHMELLNHQTNNFSLVGCNFTDSYSGYQYKNYGIISGSSNFSIDYAGTIRSSFNNLLYGIYALNNSSTDPYTFSCQHTTFNKNYFGIYSGLVNNFTVKNDTFNLYTNSSLSTAYTSYGEYIDNGYGFYVQYNHFDGTGGMNPRFGNIVNNSGKNIDGIFHNSFNYVTTGCQAQYRNYYSIMSGDPNGCGLMYLCNTFFNNTIKLYDIRVPASNTGNYTGYMTGTDTAGVQHNQGSSGAMAPNRQTADNQFSHTSATGKDFFINGYGTNYSFKSQYTYYCPYSTTSTCSNATYTSVYKPTTYANNNLQPISPLYLSSAPDCSTGGNGHLRTVYQNPLTTALSDAAVNKVVIDSLRNIIDGGSTSYLLGLINGNANAQAVFSNLQTAAPYISNDVLQAYLNSNYPTSDIVNILTTCAPLQQKVHSAVNISALSKGIKASLSSLQNGSSKMDDLLINLSALTSGRQLALDDAIRYLLNTSSEDSLAWAKQVMKEKGLELPAQSQLDIALSIHDSTWAAQILNKIASDEGQSNYVKLHTVLLQNLSKPAYEIMQDSSNVQLMQQIDKDSTNRNVYLKANALLRSVNLSDYVPYIQTEDTTSTQTNNNERHAAQPVEEGTTLISESSLYNQPNPFKESTIIQANVVEKTQNAYVVVSDILGAEIARYPVQQGQNSITINAGNLNQSVMFCTLVVDGVKITTNKMLLMK